MTDLHFGIITGLTLEENRQLATLAEVFNYHQPYNETKDKYYEGRCPTASKSWRSAATGARKPWMCWLRAACLTVL